MLFNTFPSIIALHYVSNDTKLVELKPWIITHESFVRLLDFLQAEKYATLTFEDLEKGIPSGKHVFLTFDDCPKHLIDFAIPEMLKRNMKAVFYITTANLGGYNIWGVADGMPRIDLMDENDVRKLVELGMEVGSHAHKHIMLNEFDKDYVSKELSLSKSILEKIISKPVLTVAYPYGYVPKDFKEIVTQLGFKYALSVYTTYDSKYALRRWVYDDEHTVRDIKWKMSAWYRLWRPFSDKVLIRTKKYSYRLYNAYAAIKHKLIALAGFTCIGVEDILVAF